MGKHKRRRRESRAVKEKHMSKPIMLTDAEISAAVDNYGRFARAVFAAPFAEESIERFRAAARSRGNDGKIKFEESLKVPAGIDVTAITSMYKSGDEIKLRYEGGILGERVDKCRLLFTPLAFAKMANLVRETDSELAWHGVCERVQDAAVPSFLVKDILVFPQVVTGATVDTDQEEYQNWMMALPDEQFNNLRMQGHSHVNMGCNPSSTDQAHRESILKQMPKDEYFIFIIWNKRNEHDIVVMDMANNRRYEDKEIEIDIVNDGLSIAQFISDSKALLRKPAYSYTGTAYAGTKTVYGENDYGRFGSAYDTKSKTTLPAAPITPVSATPAAAPTQPAKKGIGIGFGWRGKDKQDDNPDPFGDYYRETYHPSNKDEEDYVEQYYKKLGVTE